MLDQKTKDSHKASDEVDLGLLFNSLVSSVKSFFKGITRILFRILDKLVSNIKLVALFLVLGAIAGGLYFYSKRPYYESSMTLNSNYYNGELLDNSIMNLNEVCSEGNASVLSALLKIPAAKANKIKSIKLSPISSTRFNQLMELYSSDERYKGKLDSLLMYENQTNFQLKVEVYDTAVYKGLDTVLVNYIKANDYVKKRIEIDRLNLTSLRDKLMRESSKLDTLKRSIAASIRASGDAGRSGTNNVILGEKNVNPIDIYREDLQIYNQRQEIERQLALQGEIEVIEKFIPYGKPKSGTLVTNTVKGAIAGIILAVLLILAQILREAIARLRYNLQEEEMA